MGVYNMTSVALSELPTTSREAKQVRPERGQTDGRGQKPLPYIYRTE